MLGRTSTAVTNVVFAPVWLVLWLQNQLQTHNGGWDDSDFIERDSPDDINLRLQQKDEIYEELDQKNLIQRPSAETTSINPTEAAEPSALELFRYIHHDELGIGDDDTKPPQAP
jgi:hypothetical protein